MNEASRFRELLSDNLRGICNLTEEQAGLLYAHYQLLVRWNRHLNLTAIRGLEDIVLRHYCESLFLGAHLPGKSVSVADFGSGAGFPGLPVAVLRPDCQVTLIESHKRKAVFLREATRSYPNVVVFSGRADHAGEGLVCLGHLSSTSMPIMNLRERFDWVVARAVRWEESIGIISHLGTQAAVLIRDVDIRKLQKTNEIQWNDSIEVPWAKKSVLVMGRSCST